MKTYLYLYKGKPIKELSKEELLEAIEYFVAEVRRLSKFANRLTSITEGKALPTGERKD